MDEAVAVEDLYTTAHQRVDADAGYAGDLMVEEAWSLLKQDPEAVLVEDRKSTRLNSSHVVISYAVFCLNKKT